MPRDPEVDKLLYGNHPPPGAKAPATKSPGEAGGATAEPRPQSTGATRFIEGIHDWVGAHDPLGSQNEIEGGKGVAKAVAGAATGIPRAVNAGIGLFDPNLSKTLGDYAEQVPGVKRAEEFAKEKSGSWPETFGRIGAQGAMALAGPTQLPGKFVAGNFVRQGPTVAGAAGTLGRGAAAGAATDPNSPGTGALLGAGTAGLGSLAGKAMQTNAGQWIAGQIARRGPYAAMGALAHMIGIPEKLLWETGIAEAVLFYHSPGGQFLDPLGQAAARRLGPALDFNPAAAGAVAGGGAQALTGRR